MERDIPSRSFERIGIASMTQMADEFDDTGSQLVGLKRVEIGKAKINQLRQRIARPITVHKGLCDSHVTFHNQATHHAPVVQHNLRRRLRVRRGAINRSVRKFYLQRTDLHLAEHEHQYFLGNHDMSLSRNSEREDDIFFSAATRGTNGTRFSHRRSASK